MAGFLVRTPLVFPEFSDEIRNFQDCISLKIPVFVCFFSFFKIEVLSK